MTEPLGTETITARRFDAPDERADRFGVRRAIIQIGDTPVTRAVYPTGWTHRAAVGPEPCDDTHIGYCARGRLRAWWPDGTEVTVEEGQVFVLPPGHDAECLDECTLIQFDGGDAAARRFGLR